VQDNGRGIDEAELPQIFESFYRSKDAAERASGSGLGLTVCKRLVEAMGGRIWASNRPEGGLEVGFTLRMAPSGQPADAPGNNGRLAGAPLANESVS
jgi:signal transduction histidine kinase